jgi:hypothetical protein
MKKLRRLVGPLALALDSAFLLTGCVADVVVGLDDDVDWGDNRVEVTATFFEEVPIGSQTGLRVAGVNGTVEVRGQAGFDHVRIEAVRRVRSKTRSDALGHLPYLQVEVSYSSTNFLVETVQPNSSGGREYQVDYRITVPRDLWVDVTNANGSVLLEDLNANVWVQNANGNICVKEVTGSSWITLGNGEIDARVFLPVAGQAVYSVGNGGLSLTVQPEVSATFGAQVGNGTISLSGLTLSESVAGTNSLQGVLGGGSGTIDLSVGNGWIHAKGG